MVIPIDRFLFSTDDLAMTKLVVILTVISGLIPALADENCKHDATTFKCVKFLKNYDADTATFDIPDVHPIIGKKISVRVRHVDTPEIKGKLPCEKDKARTAQRLVENQLKNAKRIDLLNCDKDKYFRLLCDVQFDGKDLSQILIKNQLAYSYEGETKKKINWCSPRLPASE